jgi:hypothetical protein
MTLSVRNNFFRGGIVLAVLSLGFVALGGYFAFPALEQTQAASALRTGGVIQFFIEKFTKPSEYIPFITMLGAVVFSLVSIILISYYFEKTQSPEILFFGFFVISLSFEFARIVIPLKAVFPFSSFYLMSASRVLLFGRFFGLFSLFAASVHSAGFDVQKQQYVFFMLVLAALLIAMNVPIDSLTWDTSFRTKNGYSATLKVAEAGIFAITIITFFISAYTRGSKTYIPIGVGVFLAFTGRNIMLLSDTWITPLPGLLLLGIGTWFVCAKLHREYLWL